jgi:hypothetical protein
MTILLFLVVHPPHKAHCAAPPVLGSAWLFAAETTAKVTAGYRSAVRQCRFEQTGMTEWMMLCKPWGAWVLACLHRWVRHMTPPPSRMLGLDRQATHPTSASQKWEGFLVLGGGAGEVMA